MDKEIPDAEKNKKDNKKENQDKNEKRKKGPPPPEIVASFRELVDLVDADGRVKFLFSTTKGFLTNKEVLLEGRKVIPPKMKDIPYLIPRESEVWKYNKEDSDHNLYTDLVAFFKTVCELPDEKYYHLCVTWVMHTYLQERFWYTPILSFPGPPERGKTRISSAITFCSFRGLRTETVREAYMFRFADAYGGTLFIDATEIMKSLSRNSSLDLIISRFERGSKVPRVERPDQGPLAGTKYYNLFGPTVIATNGVLFGALESRCISISMPLSANDYPLLVTEDVCRPFRERLTAFRLRHLWADLPGVEKPTRGRLGDILQPLFQIIHVVAPLHEPSLRSLILQAESERKESRAESLEGEVLKALLEVRGMVANGCVLVSAITLEVNRCRGSGFPTTNKKAGMRLRSLGLKAGPRLGNERTVLWDADLISRLAESYGLALDPYN